MLHYLLLCNGSSQNAVAEDCSNHFIINLNGSGG